MAKHINDVIAEVVQEIDTDVKTDYEKKVVANIEGILNELKGGGVTGKDFNDYSADELSRIAGSLATLQFNLGELVSEAIRSVRVNEDITSYKKANLREPMKEHLEREYQRKPTQDDLRAAISKQVFKEKLRTAFKEERKENLQHLWWSIKSMLEVIGQRIKVLQAERTTNIYADNNGYIAADPRLEAKSEEVQPEQTPNTTSPAAIEQPDY